MAELTRDYFEDEDLIQEAPLSEIARRAAARATELAEETAAVESTRPTIPVFLGEPWL